MEGDPTIKGKRKQLHQEMVMSDATAKMRMRRVNPAVTMHRTHFSGSFVFV